MIFRENLSLSKNLRKADQVDKIYVKTFIHFELYENIFYQFCRFNQHISQ